MKFLPNLVLLLTIVGTAAYATSINDELASLEERTHSRIGLTIVNISNHRRVDYRGGERFLMCSTFKVLAVAAVLKRVDDGKERLDRFVKYGESQLLSYAPVTRAHVQEGGLTLEALCAAALEQSDNTAGNLLLDAIGGPQGLTAFARQIGDEFTHLDRTEPELNVAKPDSDSDTTTPAAMCANLQRLFASELLSTDSRARLERWMQGTQTGLKMIRAGVPNDWKVGDKTGRSGDGATNDIAIARPPVDGPVFISVYVVDKDDSQEARDNLVAAITRIAVASLRDQNAPCAAAISKGTVCEAANREALTRMRAAQLDAVMVVQDVLTGNLVAAATSQPQLLDIDKQLLPLSTIKLLLAASWLGHEEGGRLLLEDSDQLLTQTIVNGNDNAGRQLATTLRKALGTEAVLRDLDRYGFGSVHSLGKETDEKSWGNTLSLGEERFVATPLQLSRFLQAIGNGGVLLQPSAPSTRILSEVTARELQVLMRATVEGGTAKSVANVLAGTGWSLGGKTGTGPGPQPPGPNSDGWFAGLIFDPGGQPRFTVATFVKHGGLGGGNAARLSAELARFLSGATPL